MVRTIKTPASSEVGRMAHSVWSRRDRTLRPTARATSGSGRTSVPHYLRSAAMLANKPLKQTAAHRYKQHRFLPTRDEVPRARSSRRAAS